MPGVRAGCPASGVDPASRMGSSTDALRQAPIASRCASAPTGPPYEGPGTPETPSLLLAADRSTHPVAWIGPRPRSRRGPSYGEPRQGPRHWRSVDHWGPTESGRGRARHFLVSRSPGPGLSRRPRPEPVPKDASQTQLRVVGRKTRYRPRAAARASRHCRAASSSASRSDGPPASAASHATRNFSSASRSLVSGSDRDSIALITGP